MEQIKIKNKKKQLSLSDKIIILIITHLVAVAIGYKWCFAALTGGS